MGAYQDRRRSLPIGHSVSTRVDHHPLQARDLLAEPPSAESSENRRTIPGVVSETRSLGSFQGIAGPACRPTEHRVGDARANPVSIHGVRTLAKRAHNRIQAPSNILACRRSTQKNPLTSNSIRE